MPYDEVTAHCGGRPLPLDQCAWQQHNLRIFHFGDVTEGYFTGKFELTFVDYASEDTWECHDGRYTRDAAESTADVQFTDVPVPEGYELAAVGFSASWEDPEEFVGTLPTFRRGQGASHYKELSLRLLFESHETDGWG